MHSHAGLMRCQIGNPSPQTSVLMVLHVVLFRVFCRGHPRHLSPLSRRWRIGRKRSGLGIRGNARRHRRGLPPIRRSIPFGYCRARNACHPGHLAAPAKRRRRPRGSARRGSLDCYPARVGRWCRQYRPHPLDAVLAADATTPAALGHRPATPNRADHLIVEHKRGSHAAPRLAFPAWAMHSPHLPDGNGLPGCPHGFGSQFGCVV